MNKLLIVKGIDNLPFDIVNIIISLYSLILRDKLIKRFVHRTELYQHVQIHKQNLVALFMSYTCERCKKRIEKHSKYKYLTLFYFQYNPISLIDFHKDCYKLFLNEL